MATLRMALDARIATCATTDARAPPASRRFMTPGAARAPRRCSDTRTSRSRSGRAARSAPSTSSISAAAIASGSPPATARPAPVSRTISAAAVRVAQHDDRPPRRQVLVELRGGLAAPAPPGDQQQRVRGGLEAERLRAGQRAQRAQHLAEPGGLDPLPLGPRERAGQQHLDPVAQLRAPFHDQAQRVHQRLGGASRRRSSGRCGRSRSGRRRGASGRARRRTTPRDRSRSARSPRAPPAAADRSSVIGSVTVVTRSARRATQPLERAVEPVLRAHRPVGVGGLEAPAVAQVGDPAAPPAPSRARPDEVRALRRGAW